MQTVLEAQPLVRHVLYIEGNMSNIELVQELLSRRSDLALIYSRTGLVGIAMAVAYKPAVIILDLHLGDIKGVDALHHLRSNPETSNIPVMALSSNPPPKQVADGLEAGFCEVVPKPFQFADFLSALESCLRCSPSSVVLN